MFIEKNRMPINENKGYRMVIICIVHSTTNKKNRNIFHRQNLLSIYLLGMEFKAYFDILPIEVRLIRHVKLDFIIHWTAPK